MSILTKEDRSDLVYAMRKTLLEQVRQKGILTESKKAAAVNFILNEASYQQLLNLTWNPERETNYKGIEVLEKVALESYSNFITPEQKSMFAQVEEAVKDEDKPSVAKSAVKGAAAGGAAGYVAGAGRRAQLIAKGGMPGKKMVAGQMRAQKIGYDAGVKAAETGKSLGGAIKQSTKDAAKHSSVKGAKKVMGKLKYGGKWGRIGAGAGVVALGTAAALKARRAKKDK